MKPKTIIARRSPSAAFMPLSADEIRACEARVLGNSPKSPTTLPTTLGELAKGDPSKCVSPTPQGASLPTLPREPPKGVSLWDGRDVGDIARPRHPHGETTLGEVGRVGRDGKSPKAKPLLTIIEDTREQTPLVEWPEGVAVEEGTCHTGDYSVKGWENCFCIERKSLQDFAGTMLGGYEASSEKPKKRFNRELERMRHFDCAAVIVTATPQEVIDFKHHCGMDAHAALWGFGLSVFANYGIPVFYLGDAKTAARWIADLARHYIVCRTKKNFTKEDRSIQDLANWRF